MEHEVRIQNPGAIYLAMVRRDHREALFRAGPHDAALSAINSHTINDTENRLAITAGNGDVLALDCAAVAAGSQNHLPHRPARDKRKSDARKS